MTLETINTGAVANDRTGDTWRDAWDKVNKLIPSDPASEAAFALSGLNELVNTADLSAFYQWVFDSSTAMTDPGSGNFRLNNATPALATEIAFSDIARTGIDIFSGSFLAQQNSILTLKLHTSLTTWIVFEIGVGGAVDQTGFFTAPIDVIQSSGTFAEGDVVDVDFNRQSELEGVINVNSLADLPAPDGSGYIEIGGSVNTYEIQAGTLDLGSNTLLVTGGVVVIRGSNRFASTIKSTSTNPLITIVGAFYADEFINIDNTNGPAYDYDANGLAQAAFVSVNCVIRSCTTIGTILDANTISLRTMTIVDTSVGGLLAQGTGLLQCNISNMLGFSWTGTLLDLGTSTWDIINLADNNRWISPVGTTILSGASGSANLTANGRGLVEGNLFNGSGAAISGITTQDLQWNFLGNEFADGTTQNTRIDGDTALFPSSPPQVVTITTQGVYVAIAGSEWAEDLTNRFTFDSAGIATYIGLERMNAQIIAKATVAKVGGGSDLLCAKIAVDTGSGFAVIDKSIGCTENTAPTQIVCDAILTLSTGDLIQLFVSNVDSTSNVEITNATLAIKA